MQPSTRLNRFEGRCNDLKGHVYDSIDARQADQYTKTTREIAEFIGRTYKFGMDTCLLIKNMQLLGISQPNDSPEDATRTDIRIWEKNVNDYVKRKMILSENIKTAYSLIWGQCSDVMRQKVEAYPGYLSVSQNGDAIELLKIIKVWHTITKFKSIFHKPSMKQRGDSTTVINFSTSQLKLTLNTFRIRLM
jgi:hypothetical protein